MAKRHKNTLLRIQRVCEITQQHYEPGRQDRCYAAVWRNYVYPIYPMCYHTYLSYLGVNVKMEQEKEGRLKLFES